MAKAEKGRADGLLTKWLLEVLSHQTRGATLDLGNGREAMIRLDGNRLIAYEYAGDSDEEVWLSVLEFPSV